MKIEVQGVDEVKARLEEQGRRYADALKASIFVAGAAVIDETTPLVPEVSGDLRRSSFVRRADPVEAGYAAYYAAWVHEKQTSAGWKFLNRGMQQAQDEVMAVVRRETPRFVASGTTLDSVPARYSETPRSPRRRRKYKGVRPRKRTSGVDVLIDRGRGLERTR